MIKLTTTVQFRRGRHARPGKEKVEESPAGRIPRIARLMALAIRFDGLIQEGIVTDQ